MYEAEVAFAKRDKAVTPRKRMDLDMMKNSLREYGYVTTVGCKK
jgi:hypothetical protein